MEKIIWPEFDERIKTTFREQTDMEKAIREYIKESCQESTDNLDNAAAEFASFCIKSHIGKTLRKGLNVSIAIVEYLESFKHQPE